MRQLPAAQMREALQWLLFASTFWGGWLPVRLGDWTPREVIWRSWAAPREQCDLATIVQRLDEQYADEVLLGIPHSKPFNGGVGKASLLWCRVEGDKQLAAAHRFRPLPGLVLAEGSTSRRWLFWPLDNPAPWSDLKAANRRIAYAMRSTQKHGDPDAAWFPAPGTCLRTDRARPVPVRVSRLKPVSYRVSQVAGGLKEPPAIDWWKTA
jgi:hypothetical protein